MRKLFMFILAIASTIYLGALLIVQIGWGGEGYVEMIATYGGVIIAGSIAGVAFIGKGIKLILFIAVALIILLFIIFQSNPEFLNSLRG